MTGVIPSEEFNEQLKRGVREDLRRLRSEVQSRNRWHKKGGAGGGATGSCCGKSFAFNVPHSKQKFPGQHTWTSGCGGGDLPTLTAHFPDASSTSAAQTWFDRNNGHLEWSGGKPVLTWRSTFLPEWYRDIGSELRVYNDAGADVTASSSVAGFLLQRYDFCQVHIQALDPTNGFNVRMTDYFKIPLATDNYNLVNHSPMRFQLRNSHSAIQSKSFLREWPLQYLCTVPTSHTVADLLTLDIQQTFTAGTYPQFNVTIEIEVSNASTEDITIDYEKALFASDTFASSNFFSDFSFTVSSGSSETRTIATGTLDYPWPSGDNTVSGQVSGTGDLTSDLYSASDTDVQTFAH